MSESLKVYESQYSYFITCTVVHWLSVFSRRDYFQILTDSLTFCTKNKGLQIQAYVLMPTHFHMICSAPETNLSDVMRDMKKHTSKECAKKLAEDGKELWLRAMKRAAGNTANIKVWEEDFHPEQIHKKQFFKQKLDYIHKNPVEAGYVMYPQDWLHSSAGFYYEDREPTVPLTPVMWL